MKISTKVMDRIVIALVMLFLLTPPTVFAQDGFYVIPVAMNRPLKNVITVAKANGKFTDPVAAVNSITDASANNPYLVVIAPGVYTITQTLAMKPYVDIAGSGENVTKIKGAISTGTVSTSVIISGADHSTLTAITVENTGGSKYSIALYNGAADSNRTVGNVTAIARGGAVCYGVYNDYGSNIIMIHVTARAIEGTAANRGVYNYQSEVVMRDVEAHSNGAPASVNFGIDNRKSSVRGFGTGASAGGGIISYGVYNIDSTVTLKNSLIGGETNGLYTELGTSILMASSIVGGVNDDGLQKCIACDNGSGTVLNATCN